MSEQTKLDKDKILTTVSRRILFDCLLKGMLVKDAAKEAKLGVKYAQNMVEYSGIKALALETRAKLSEKVGITVEQQQRELVADIESAREAKAWGAVMSGRATLLKSIGGMTGDRPHPDSIKARDAKNDEFLRLVAERVYAERYLALPAETCRDTDGTITVLDLRPLDGPTVGDQGQEGQNVQRQEQATGSEQSSEGPI